MCLNLCRCSAGGECEVPDPGPPSGASGQEAGHEHGEPHFVCTVELSISIQTHDYIGTGLESRMFMP